MTTLSPIDARFACICGGTSKQHPTTRGCEHCKECDYYRPSRCVCHLRRDDGKTPRCYFDHGNGDVVGHVGKCEATSEVAGAGFFLPTELPAFEPRLVPELDREQGQSGANVVGESDGDTSWLVRGSALTAEGPAGSNPAHSQPFWQSLAAARDEKILAEAGPNPGPEYVLVADNNGRYSYQPPHRAHKRLRGLSARYRACQECGDSLLAWMAARSGNVHMQQRAADYIKANNVPGYEWLLARYYPEAS